MSDASIARKTALVGIGTSDFSYLYRNLDPERTREELAVLALKEALDDAGLAKSDIDGLVVGGSPEYHSFMFRSGLQDVRYLAHYPIAGRLCPIALGQAAMAIEHGMCNYVAMFNSVNFRSAARSFGAPSEGTGDLYDSVFGMASPGAFYSLAFTRYQQLYGGTEEELGAIAVAFRKHASMNPRAVMQNPITIDDYMSARYIAKPLRLFDYCLVNDGAVCYILTSADRAKDLKQPPVHVGGFGMRTSIREEYASEDFWEAACATMKKDVMGPLGLTTRDIDSVEMYDNFSLSLLWGLEGFGFAPKGEGLQWIQNGRIELGGELPVNTSGGMLSEAYLQGWNNHAESVRQLRGQAGERQIPNCKTILYYGLSVVPTASVLFAAD